MTAQIINFARYSPQELCQAEANEAAACALTEARAQWSENREALGIPTAPTHGFCGLGGAL